MTRKNIHRLNTTILLVTLLAGVVFFCNIALKGATLTGEVWTPSAQDRVLNISGNYPHLTVYSPYGECGIGAVAAWADKLWFITYPPHYPEGSLDKLYCVDTNLTLSIRPESVGGTHANRFIHRESQQLIIGPYFIDTNGQVRVPDIHQLRARLTATMRHLTHPNDWVYFFGMERELYEVNVHSLAVKRIYGEMRGPFPGYHGKGAYTSHGRVVIAHNGEPGWSLTRDPRFQGPSGVLAESDGRDWQKPWSVVERKTFCEVTGPGGLLGNAPGDDRLWATGWDKRSVILKLLDQGRWQTYRLPKASYSHDALHGWYTEWPRIRELQPNQMLMHMHGLFISFPKSFSAANVAGLRPISTYLKMPVDYCWWNGQIVMARDDASIMQNELAGQSHSSLWFGQVSDLARYGVPAGWGGPWLQDDVKAGEASDPLLLAGFQRRLLHLKQQGARAATFTLEVDAQGQGQWTKADTLTLTPGGYVFHLLPADLQATWIRLVPQQSAEGVTAYFHLGNPPQPANPSRFQALAEVSSSQPLTDGLIKPSQGDARTLIMAMNSQGPAGVTNSGFYQMNGSFKLERMEAPDRERVLRAKYGLDQPEFSSDAASVIIQEGTNRFRLPKTAAAYDQPFASGWPRARREVVTERNLLNVHGTFYELPRTDSGGLRRLRPITTHEKHISDFCRWRGLLVLAGTLQPATPDGHYFRSEDGQTGLWLGDVDDLWQLGKPRGQGGPWRQTAVTAHQPSDPYLMTGYDRKTLELSHDAASAVTFKVEVDFLADGTWSEYRQLTVPPGQTYRHPFPSGYSAHWIRLGTDQACRATARFDYE